MTVCECVRLSVLIYLPTYISFYPSVDMGTRPVQHFHIADYILAQEKLSQEKLGSMPSIQQLALLITRKIKWVSLGFSWVYPTTNTFSINISLKLADVVIFYIEYIYFFVSGSYSHFICWSRSVNHWLGTHCLTEKWLAMPMTPVSILFFCIESMFFKVFWNLTYLNLRSD